ncbi:MAG: aldo/keto reductase [Halobaculum sp.]
MTSLELPSPGLGTSGNDEFEECAETVARALEIGYRHVDTAQMYDNEEAVGEGLRRAAERGIDREEVAVASKIHPDNLGYEDAKRTAHESLDRLGLETLDMLYVHWPVSAYDPDETLRAFAELADEGVMDHFCVSNFTPALLDEVRERIETPIAAHQVECHPLLPQRELREYAREDDHWLVAYSPLGGGELLDHPTIERVADREETTPAAVCLAWALDKERVIPIPKGTGDHVRANYEATQLSLSDEAMAELDSLDERERVVDPDAAAWND